MTNHSKSSSKNNVRKQLRFASTVSTNDAASITRAALAQEATLYPETGGKSQFWYSKSDFESCARYNKDLVAYASSAGPQTAADWGHIEYALNIHGHSLRGCEKINKAMPGADKRDEKKEMAIYGVLEAISAYKGDDEQIARISQRLSNHAVKYALELGELDELAPICFPAEYEMKDHHHKCNKQDISDTESETDEEGDDFDDDEIHTSAVKKTRRRSKGTMRKDILEALCKGLRPNYRCKQ